jgi:hypothetical protein
MHSLHTWGEQGLHDQFLNFRHPPQLHHDRLFPRVLFLDSPARGWELIDLKLISAQVR